MDTRSSITSNQAVRIAMQRNLKLPPFEPFATAVVEDDNEHIARLVPLLLNSDKFVLRSTANDRGASNFVADSFPFGILPDPKQPRFSRVFMYSYVNRDGVDRHLLGGFARTLNRQPSRAFDIGVIPEYPCNSLSSGQAIDHHSKSS